MFSCLRDKQLTNVFGQNKNIDEVRLDLEPKPADVEKFERKQEAIPVEKSNIFARSRSMKQAKWPPIKTTLI